MIFYEVTRRGRRWGARNLKNYGAFGKVLIQTDNRERAEAVYKKTLAQIRQGDVILWADGFPQAREDVWMNRTRW